MPNLWQIRYIDDHQENVDLVQVAVLAIMNIGIDCVSPSNQVITRLYYYFLVYICFWVRSTESSCYYFGALRPSR
jgi:hypothetical protein